jgi:hypothetical protein
VQRDLALLGLFAGTDVDRAVVQVDVGAVKAERLSGAQAADRQQPDDRRASHFLCKCLV